MNVLVVLVASIPFVKISPSTEIIANLGDKVELECNVPFPSSNISSISWMFGTVVLSDIDGVSTMLADGVSFLNHRMIMSRQAGLYTCKACVADLCSTNKTTITVQSK